MTAVVVRDLHKSYGDIEAVRGIDFTIETGEVFGLLGPNGAGKTTTVEILEGYRPRTSGTVEVLGTDPQRAGPAWREHIGVMLQSSSLYPALTVIESLRTFAGYYSAPRDAEEVVEIIGLGERRDARVRKLSGGQQRRLDLGIALIGDPELIFLDEPTTGFDPAARRAAWEVVRALRDLGKTVVLTTHYLDEAQALADRVAILKDGRILAEGSPDSLGASHYRVAWRDAAGSIVERFTDDPTTLLARLTADALARGERLEELSVTRPSLEDVYLELTETVAAV